MSHVRICGHPVPPRLPVPESIRRPPAVSGARNSEAIVVMNLPVAGPSYRLPSVMLGQPSVTGVPIHYEGCWFSVKVAAFVNGS
jgi:hypothetical protein